MGRGVGWSLANVQFVRDGMAGGANLSLLARSRGWSYSSLEKLVRRIRHGESATRKQRASRVHADVVDRMEEDIQTNPRQSWSDLAVKYECSHNMIRRKLPDRGFHTYKRCKTLKCKTVHHEIPCLCQHHVCSHGFRHARGRGAQSQLGFHTKNWRSDAANWPPAAALFAPGFVANSPDLNPLDYHVWAAWQNEVNKVLKEPFAGQAKNEMEMEAAVSTAWTQVDQNAVKRSIASWPKRLLLCIEKEGGIRPRDARVVD